MTHHIGYTLLFEQALQVVSPAVTIPYWEYTIEGEQETKQKNTFVQPFML